jgi:hypothetical protein
MLVLAVLLYTFPLTTVGVCVDPVGVGQVYAGGVDGNVHVKGVMMVRVLSGTKSALDRHHLFPKRYLEKIGITETKDVNQIPNFALVEWPDNLDISDLAPSVYFPKYASYMSNEIRYWHGLPEGWEHMKYHDFLAVRRKAIARVIHDAFKQLSNVSSGPQLDEYTDPPLEESD